MPQICPLPQHFICHNEDASQWQGHSVHRRRRCLKSVHPLHPKQFICHNEYFSYLSPLQPQHFICHNEYHNEDASILSWLLLTIHLSQWTQHFICHNDESSNLSPCKTVVHLNNSFVTMNFPHICPHSSLNISYVAMKNEQASNLSPLHPKHFICRNEEWRGVKSVTTSSHLSLNISFVMNMPSLTTLLSSPSLPLLTERRGSWCIHSHHFPASTVINSPSPSPLFCKQEA